MKITFDPIDIRSSSQALIWSWVHSQVLFVRLGMEQDQNDDQDFADQDFADQDFADQDTYPVSQ